VISVKTAQKKKRQILRPAIIAMFAALLLLISACSPNTTPASVVTSSPANIIETLKNGVTTKAAQGATGSVATNCAADSVQVPGSHGQYGEVDATFAPAVDALVASGTSREEANRQVLLAHAKDNAQRLAIWSFAAHLWADPNNTTSLEKDGCLSSEGQALWQKLADAIGDASIAMGHAPLNGTDSGVVNGKYVVADHPGINGSTVAAIMTLKSGVVIIISEWCGNVIYVIVNPVVPTSPVIVQRPTPVPPVVFIPPAKPPVVVPPVVVPKDVQRCDSKTKTDNVTVSEETAKDTDRYKPVGDVACHPVEVIKACIKDSGDTTLKPVDKFDDKTMSTNPADCVKPPCDCTPPPPVWRCDVTNWTYVQVTPEQAKDTTQYSDVPETDCVPPVVCVKADHPKPGSDWTWDETKCEWTPPAPPVCVKADHPKPGPDWTWDEATCKWCPPVIVSCPEGETPNPDYPATSPDKCLTTKSPNPGDYTHEEGAPPAVADPVPSAPGLDHTTTETGGRGDTVIDTPTITDPTAPSGVTAPGADAPNPTPPTQVNEGGATESNGTNSGTVTSAPIDAPTVVAPAPAVNDQAAAAAAQAAANQAAKDAADVAAVQAARAQAQATQVVVVQKTQTVEAPAPAVTKTATTTKATAPAAAQAAPAAAPTTATTEAGAPVVSVTTPAAPAASVGG
jgi:hypothetical protein